MAGRKWYVDFFRDEANRFWDGVITAEQTAAEMNLLLSCIGAAQTMLDVPAGSGRIARLLAENGKTVTAVDISEQNVAKLVACGRPSLTPVQADMLNIEYRDEFDAACCLGNSFSYFDYRGMARFIGCVSAALKRDGIFIAHSGTVAESLLLNLEERTWYNAAGLDVLLEHSYDPNKSMLSSEYTFIDGDGKRRSKTIYHYVYTCSEIRRMFAASGMKVEAVYGDCDGGEYAVGSPECYFAVRKC